MKKSILLLVLSIAINNSFCQEPKAKIEKYTSFLKTQNTSAKEYIESMFKKYDVVVLCERHHGELTQYELITDIIRSDYFTNNVGTIFTEIGAVDNRKNVLEFITTKFKTDEEKQKQQLKIYRNMGFPYWEKTNMFNFIGDINSLNSKLKRNRKINLFVSNNRNPTSEECSTDQKFMRYFNSNFRKRDSIMSRNIITTFDSISKISDRKKCLIIMNYRHAFSKTLHDDGTKNVGQYLAERYKDKFANVFINGVAPTIKVAKSDINKATIFQNSSETPIQNGKWDASFIISKKENIGFDFKDSPFGNDSFDIWPYTEHNYKYEDIFAGFVYYLPLEKHIDGYGIPYFLDDGYLEELYEKEVIFSKALKREPTKKEDIEADLEYHEERYDDLKEMELIINEWLQK